MDKTLFAYIRRYSGRQQVIVTLMAVASFPFLYLFYELPKLIINEAISATTFEFPLDVNIDFDAFIFAISWETGLSLDQETFLFVLCGAFLVLVVINQAFKYVINVYKGLTGERMLRRLRFELYSRVLRFPLPTFRKMSQGEIIPMVTAEVEPLGGFIGDAYSLPSFQGGTLLTILGFLFYQDWRMATAAVTLYPLQLWLIPKLQRRVNILGKERVQRVRRLSDKIGETVQGVQEIHSNDASNYAMADFAERLGSIFDIRYQIYKQKFVIKFLNNFIQQLGPFFFYAIGGYFVIQGELAIGTLVAAIAAHKDLAAPWKALLTYYQQQADANIKYDQVISQFEPAAMRDASNQLADADTSEAIEGEFSGTNIILLDEQEVAVIDSASFRFPLSERVAVVGSSGSGKEELIQIMARLLDPQNGGLNFGPIDLDEAPEAITGRRLSYVGPNAYIFAGTIADNLFFGLKHRPLILPEYSSEEAAERKEWHHEARLSGNLDFDVRADWLDYAAAGVGDMPSLRQKSLQILSTMGLMEDVYRFGLRGTIDPAQRQDVAEKVLQARKALHTALGNDAALSVLVEGFDKDLYNANATVGENLLFGNPIGDAFDMERLGENEYVLETLAAAELTEDFLQIGFQVAATMIELFADLPPEHELFQQFSFIAAEELPDIQALLHRTDRSNLSTLTEEDRNRLMSLPFKLIPARHRLGLIEGELREQILLARRLFADNLPAELENTVAFFDFELYNPAANIQDNILFGRIAYGQAEAQERVSALIGEVIAGLNLRDTIAEVGLDYNVGIAGSRLTGEQRQKLALSRAMMKTPDCLLLSDATNAFDSTNQAMVLANIVEAFDGRCLVWGVMRPSMAESFDRILVMRQGRVVEQGTHSELSSKQGLYKELLDAE